MINSTPYQQKDYGKAFKHQILIIGILKMEVIDLLLAIGNKKLIAN